MEQQGSPKRQTFWEKRHSPWQAVGIVVAGLTLLPALIVLAWIGLILVGCSVDENCIG